MQKWKTLSLAFIAGGVLFPMGLKINDGEAPVAILSSAKFIPFTIILIAMMAFAGNVVQTKFLKAILLSTSVLLTGALFASAGLLLALAGMR